MRACACPRVEGISVDTHEVHTAHDHQHAAGCGHTDYLHDGHAHAAHDGHYDEH